MSRAHIAGLVAAMVVVAALGSHVTHWSGIAGLATAGIAVAALAALGVLVAWFRPGSRVGGRMIAVHTHGGHGTKLAARHEAGHYHVALKVGAKVHGAEIYPDGSGVTWVQMPRGASVVDEIAVDVAGHVAAGTTAGCDGFHGSDFDQVRRQQRRLPSRERAAAKQAGYAKSRQLVRRSPIKRTERRLLKHGSIS